MTDAPQNTPQDPLADIATPAAVAVWLTDVGLDPHAAAFAARGWHGDALLDASESELADVLGAERMPRMNRLLRPLRALRFQPPPALSQAERDKDINKCKELGADWQRQPWLVTVLETWPGPIAHEVHMLGDLLNAGKVAGALLQMRDVAEILIKLPAVILVRDLLEHGASAPVAAKIHQTLYHSALAMGTWLSLLRDDLTPTVQDLAKAEPALIAPEIAALFRSPSGQLTPLYRALEHQNTRRNWDIGHGAFRFDEGEIVATLRHYLLGDLPKTQWAGLGLQKVVTLAEGFAFAVTLDGWQRLTLTLTSEDGERPLRGWQSIRVHHDRALPTGHAEHLAAVRLTRADSGVALTLAPYLAARTCGLCGYQDVFFFNGWDREKNRYDLLDYFKGHRMRRAWHEVPDLHQDSRRLPLPATADAAPTEGLDLDRGSVVALLDATAFDRRYLSPDYLRQPLREFLERETRGVFWLDAPGHIGKSMFVRGLAEAESAGEQPLLDDLKVVAVFIRKEYRYGPAALLPLLETALKQALDLAERQDRRLPQIDLNAADKAAALAEVLTEFRELAHFQGRLLVCLDGLDELRPPENGVSVLDFLPAPDALPARTYLLLTSRAQTDAGCPAWVWERPAARLAGRPGFQRYAVAVADSGYRALLRGYFQRELEAGRAKLESRLLGEGHAPGAAQRAATERLDRLFEALLNKADGLFLHFAFLIDRINERDLVLDEQDIAQLPERRALFDAYLDELPAALAPKHAELAKTVLLTLAAVEQAHAWYIDGREPPFAVEPEWRGVAFAVLADLTHQQGAEGDLVYLLFRLKSALGTWRGEAAPGSRYRLGVKGLTEAIANHPAWGPLLAATHERLAREVLALLAPPTDDAPGEAATTPEAATIEAVRLRYALAHATHSGDAALVDGVAGNRTLWGSIYANGLNAHDDYRFPKAIGWWTLAILHAEPMQGGGEPAWINDLAGAYMNRGTAKRHASGHGLGAALNDYNAAIKLREALRAELEPAGRWEVGLRNDLATAYMNRGNAKLDASGHGPGAALSDYDAAIKLMDALRAKLEPAGRWEVGLRNDLAMAYMNRGTAKQDASGHGPGAALADYDAAVGLMEALRAELDPAKRWGVGFRDSLAHAYMVRGTAKHRVSGHSPGAGLADIDTAIRLWEALRAALEPVGCWEVRLRHILAGAYMNRGNAKMDTSGHGPGAALIDYDAAIALMDALRAELEPTGCWEVGLRNDLARVYMNRGDAKRVASGHGPDAALADYDAAINLREALRAELEPAGRWEVGLRNDLALAYRERGIARHQSGRLPGAVADWGAAAAIYLTVVQQGWLPAGDDLLKMTFGAFIGYRDLAEWPSVAQCLVAFIEFYRQLEALWAERHGDLEPPWRDIVGQFAGAVHGLNPDQRAALLEALGGNAEVVKQAFGWE
ncbi:MAG: hypothetical protein P9F19_12290 [Candidatus Contendobacter sp.]|nr:hypothetical protein [Candidatus Contendobacter sp.]